MDRELPLSWGGTVSLIVIITKQIFFIFSIGLFCIPAICLAGNPVSGCRAAAMGTAFGGIADDPSTMAYNPAGLTNLKGNHLYGGFTALNLSSEYQTPSGESEKTNFRLFFPPHLFITSDFGFENTSFGLALFSPYGIGGREWSEVGLTKYVSTVNTIATFAINPNVAWRIMPEVSVAIGGGYLIAINESERMVDQSLLGNGDGKMSIDTHGGGWGFNAGVLIFPEKKISLGLAYRSGTKVEQSGNISIDNIAPPLQPFFGGSTFETDADLTLNFPEIWTASAAFRFTEKWTIGLEVEWTGWSSFDKMDLDIKTEIPEAGITDSSTALDWKDAWLFKVGGEYKLNDRVRLRGGYAFLQNPVPDRTLTPATPESEQHNISAGLGYKIKQWTIDTFYMAAFFINNTVDNDILSGEYSSFTHYLGFSLGYSF